MFKKIMGLVEKATIKGNTSARNNNKEELTKEEYEFLFGVLKNTDFKGHQVESLYNLVIKLQKHYLNLVNNQ